MSDKKRGILLVLSGFSGSGKGTVIDIMMEKHPDDMCLSVSATTREPRKGEVEAEDYFFVSRERFEEMIKGGMFLEYAEYVGNYYGTPREYVESNLLSGRDVILEIEQQGAFQVKAAMPEAVLVFLSTPTVKELERRLRARGTESEEQILGRLSRAQEESLHIDRYDYFAVNDVAADCADEIYEIIEKERRKTVYCREHIETIQRDLLPYKAD